jgi:3-phosphoshikimate 1-carboxyvinyltransferase
MIYTIQPGTPLRGAIRCPGDKSISHRYAMLAALAQGESELSNYAASQDCQSTLRCLRSLGVEIRTKGASVLIAGDGLRGLKSPAVTLDAGNSGTTMRLLAGILAGQPFDSKITGDASLRRRPMGRIIEPLRLMGAEIGSAEGDLPPLHIKGGNLRAIRYSLPVASAQVKSCILLAGLYAKGITAVEENVATRDHTEIALQQFGAAVRHRGHWIEIEPGPALEARRLDIPGDLSGAAFLIAAAALVPGSEILLPQVGLNPRRRALIHYLGGAGVRATVENESAHAGEPRGDLRVCYDPAPLRESLPPIAGELTAALIDEIPVLAVLGSQSGGLVIRDARELRVKESDRIAAVAANLRAMGAQVEEHPDGLTIAGRQRLHGAEIETHGDHRIAMAFAVAGLAACGVTRVHDAECADVSFPGFYEALAECRKEPEARSQSKNTADGGSQ